MNEMSFRSISIVAASGMVDVGTAAFPLVMKVGNLFMSISIFRKLKIKGCLINHADLCPSHCDPLISNNPNPADVGDGMAQDSVVLAQYQCVYRRSVPAGANQSSGSRPTGR